VIPNELLPEAILRHHTLTFDSYFKGPLPPDAYCFATSKGNILSFYPIVPGLLNLPAYAIAEAAGARFERDRQSIAKATTSWVSAVSVACMYLLLIRVLPGRPGNGPRKGAALFFALIYAFATCLWPIGSQALWQHGPSLMFLTGALACLARPESRVFPLAGFLLGMAVWNRPVNSLIVAPLGLYVLLHHPRRVPALAASAALPLLALALYSQLYWGSLLSLGQGFRSSTTLAGRAFTFDGPLLSGLSGILLSPARGLFVFTPVFLLAIPALVVNLVHPAHPLLRYLIVAILIHILLISKLSWWWAGHSFGYRYLLEVTPAFTLLLALTWCAARRQPTGGRWFQALFWPLLAASVYAQFLGAIYFPCGWNAHPVNVDLAPERLWDVRDTELGRCQARFVDDLESVASQ
jgi:hypothetical protein